MSDFLHYPGEIVKVFGVDSSYHGIAEIIDTDRVSIRTGRAIVLSYLIRFVDPATDNARNWNNGTMSGSWIGFFEKAC